MNLVPESLNELQKFERGVDPKEAMRIGRSLITFTLLRLKLNAGSTNWLEPEKVIRILSGKESDKLYREYFAEGENPNGNYEMFWMFELMLNKVPYKYIKYKGETYPIIGKVNEFLNFERGVDPKEAMRIGINRIISEITSDDLELIADLLELKEGIVSYEDWYKDHGEDYEDDEEAKESYNRLHLMALAIDGKVKWGGFYDHKEVDEMEEYLETPPVGMEYAYNAYPGGDGWQVVWSNIVLPSAEPIIA